MATTKQQLEVLLGLSSYATTTSLAAEVTARSSEVASEAAARSSADASEATARSSAVAAEATARSTAVASLAAAKQNNLANGNGTTVTSSEATGYVSVNVDGSTITIDQDNKLKAIAASANWTTVTNQPLINNHSLASGNNTAASLGVQDTLVSGTNIKTVNSTSILGSGNIAVATVASQSSLASSAASAASAISSLASSKADSASVYTKSEVDSIAAGKQATLLAGVTIKNINDASILGSGSISVATPAEVNSESARAQASEASILEDLNAATSEANAAFEILEDVIDTKADKSNVYTQSQVDAKVDAKQDTLVSGTNIKTINGIDILGSGDIDIDIPEALGNAAVWKTNAGAQVPILTRQVGAITMDTDISALANISDVTRTTPEVGDFVIDWYNTIGVILEIYGDPMLKVITIEVADYTDVAALFTLEA